MRPTTAPIVQFAIVCPLWEFFSVRSPTPPAPNLHRTPLNTPWHMDEYSPLMNIEICKTGLKGNSTRKGLISFEAIPETR